MRRKVVLLSGLVGPILVGALLLGWAAERRPDIPYLPENGPGHWILYPAVIEPTTHPIGERSTVFLRSFELAQPPRQAPLRIRAFGSFAVQVNGRALAASEPGLAHDWKREVEVDAAPALVAGDNHLAITVSHERGPPALWLALEVAETPLVSDASWECSLLGAVVQPARLAAAAPELRKGNPAVEGESVGGALRRGWPELVLLVGVAVVAVLGLDVGVRRGLFTPPRRLHWLPVVLSGVAIPWLGLVLNSSQSLLVPIGFDAADHIKYIQHVRQKAALPLASEGMEMHQPPLYYVLSAAALSLCGLDAGEPGGVLLLRGLSLLTGLTLVLLLAGGLRRVMPQAPMPQAVGLVVAVALPVHLSLIHYVSNDLLAATLATAAVYLTLTVLQAARSSWGHLIALGLCLGAAVLTKLTAAAAILVILTVLAGQLAARRSPPSVWLRSLGVPLLVCVTVSGWFFVRNVYHFGTPLLGSFDPRSGFGWWQDPGYCMAAQGLRFGRSLSQPFYSAFVGIGDGLYSTLWGDGAWSGMPTRETRPPWSYDRMAVGYLLALLPGSLALVGTGAAVVELVRRPQAEGFLLVGLPAGLCLAILYHYARYPFSCHLKAFYALPAVLSLCAFAGQGFALLTRGYRWRQLVVGAALAAWALVAYSSFWVNGTATTTQLWLARQYMNQKKISQALACLEATLERDRDNPEVRRLFAQILLTARQPKEAAVELQQALATAPEDPEAHLLLASALTQQKQNGPACQHLEQAIALRPDSVRAYRLLGKVRLLEADASGARVAARNGLRVRAEDADLHTTLAAALAAEGKIGEAVQHYQTALRWQPSSVDALKALARLRATCEDDRYRNGNQALELARRACELTQGRDVDALEVLAASYAQCGQFRAAERVLKDALEAARKREQEGLLGPLQRQLRLYQREQPLREKPLLDPRHFNPG